MIGETLLFLRDQLNEHLKVRSGWNPADPWEDKVVLPDGETMDPITFQLGAVTELLINLEEENTLRAAAPYRRTLSDGTTLQVQPDIRLNIYLLFVARFKQYEQGLRYLSRIIHFFQSHRVFDRAGAPALPASLEKLVLELVTLPFSEQNEIWNALRTTYHPSLLYKVGLIVYRDEESQQAPEIREAILITPERT